MFQNDRTHNPQVRIFPIKFSVKERIDEAVEGHGCVISKVKLMFDVVPGTIGDDRQYVSLTSRS